MHVSPIFIRFQTMSLKRRRHPNTASKHTILHIHPAMFVFIPGNMHDTSDKNYYLFPFLNVLSVCMTRTLFRRMVNVNPKLYRWRFTTEKRIHPKIHFILRCFCWSNRIYEIFHRAPYSFTLSSAPICLRCALMVRCTVSGVTTLQCTCWIYLFIY